MGIRFDCSLIIYIFPLYLGRLTGKINSDVDFAFATFHHLFAVYNSIIIGNPSSQ